MIVTRGRSELIWCVEQQCARLIHSDPSLRYGQKVMGFKCGIVGLPNVGKSSLFNALTSSAIAAENYAFCTIEPNVGAVAVPDPRLQRIADIVLPRRVVP